MCIFLQICIRCVLRLTVYVKERKREKEESHKEKRTLILGITSLVGTCIINLINYFLNLLALKCISSIYLEESFREHFMAKRNFKAFYLHYYTEFLSIPFFPSSILLFFLYFFPSSFPSLVCIVYMQKGTASFGTKPLIQ